MPELQMLRSGTEDEIAIQKAREENIKLLVLRSHQLCLRAEEECLSECILISHN
ncbi:hypothetical protein Ciccas_007264, partial [Cichlidogyrus casuarinus]